MTPAETAAEREARERLYHLSQSLRDNQRPPIRRAVDALLSGNAPLPDDPDGLLLQLPKRSFRLRHRKSFKPTGAGTGAIDLFVLQDERGGPPFARLIAKTIHRTAVEMGNIQWLAEALFYLDLAPRIEGEGIAIPDVHGCSVTAQGVTLVLSFIPPPQPPLSPQPAPGEAARAIGRLGAVTHLNRLHEAGWLEAVRPRLMPETFLALETLVEAAFPDSATRERSLAAFEAFIGDAGQQRRLDQAGTPCLSHGDLHPRNLLKAPDGSIAFIDWSHVGSGSIGHDLGRWLLPDYLYEPLWQEHTHFAAAVAMMAGEVLAGTRAVMPEATEDGIRTAVDRTIIVQAAKLGVVRRTILERQLATGGPAFRQRLSDVVSYATEAAERLTARYG